MKITFTENIVVPGHPEFLKDETYFIEDILAETLIARGQAIGFKDEEVTKPKKSVKKS